MITIKKILRILTCVLIIQAIPSQKINAFPDGLSNKYALGLTALAGTVGAVCGSFGVTRTISKLDKPLLWVGLPTLIFGGWRLNNYSNVALGLAVGAFVGGLYSYWMKPSAKERPDSQQRNDSHPKLGNLPLQNAHSQNVQAQHSNPSQPPLKKENTVVIKEFDYERDKDAVLALFEADRNFLQVSPGYNLDRDLKTRSLVYAQVPNDYLQVKVLYEGKKLAGFVTYYVNPQDSASGFIPMLCVGKKFRGKKYARQLGEAVKKSFQEWGVRTVKWNVLKVNTHALGWYERIAQDLFDFRTYYQCLYTM